VCTQDNLGNWLDWTTLFTLQSPKGRYTYDDQPPLISDTIAANGSVITTSWPVISAALYDPQPGLGVQPLSTTLIIDSEVVTPQVNTAGGFAYTPTVRLTEGVHSVTAQVYDQAGNQILKRYLRCLRHRLHQRPHRPERCASRCPTMPPATSRPGDLKSHGCLDFTSTGSAPLDNRGRLC
jgi:hypothetical protein